ncbi:hypothetical protein [Methylobrevis albus]|uniref:Uncharacterized protein n=1 Tax=Methylobrevis albus TaxID=2793297 RepID=A0A931I2P4_9HYPH|nr:hypothetical protein [Methylobrevis albus]MBH0237816.1 hypothetical protein [Methylobrevis albus]
MTDDRHLPPPPPPAPRAPTASVRLALAVFAALLVCLGFGAGSTDLLRLGGKSGTAQTGRIATADAGRQFVPRESRQAAIVVQRRDSQPAPGGDTGPALIPTLAGAFLDLPAARPGETPARAAAASAAAGYQARAPPV